MSLVDNLVSNLVERNTIRLNGTFTITLVDGGVSLKGQVFSTIRDREKNKDLVNNNGAYRCGCEGRNDCRPAAADPVNVDDGARCGCEGEVTRQCLMSMRSSTRSARTSAPRWCPRSNRWSKRSVQNVRTVRPPGVDVRRSARKGHHRRTVGDRSGFRDRGDAGRVSAIPPGACGRTPHPGRTRGPGGDRARGQAGISSTQTPEHRCRRWTSPCRSQSRWMRWA